MADEYKINVKDVDDTSSTPSGAYYIPTDDLGSGGGGGGSELPAVTSDDNGDVLTVVSGAWAKADPPSSLPTVTSDDNGDVLTVVEGAWAKAAPSGGLFIVTADVDENDDITLDKTLAEIIAAYKAGQFPIMLMHSYGVGEGNISDGIMFLTGITDYQGESSVNNGATFSTVASVDGSNGVGTMILEIASDDSLNVSIKAYPGGE